MDSYERIVRNTVEELPEDEVCALADAPDGKRAYVGYEPSGVLHLGHMITANKLMDLQDAGLEVVVLLADVHAYLNGKGSFEEIHETADQMRDQLIAHGLDERATEFVLGSEFQAGEEYQLDLHRLELETTLNRAQRAMAEIQGDNVAHVSHVVYPLMQALDIEYLDIDLAVGGLDQRKVHALQREVLPEIGYDARPAIHTPILADLETGFGKMSASEDPKTGEDSMTISFEDSPATVEDKVSQIFFPPERDPNLEEHHDPEAYDVDPSAVTLHNPALQLFEYYIFPRFEHVVVERQETYGGTVTYESYESLAEAVDVGDLHPEPVKDALGSYLNELIPE